MEIANARYFYDRYAAAMAYVVVGNSDGSESIGSAFHVGEGVFVTARHVVEGKDIREVATVAHAYIRLSGEEAEKSLCTIVSGDEKYKAYSLYPAVLAIEKGPYHHPDDGVDIAVFRVANIDTHTPAIPLGDHLDDWLGQDDFVLTEVVVLGFPPIPFAGGPHLFAARGEVNALMDLRHAKHPHFLVSAMPRGGFSGGVVLSRAGTALGVVTQSLVMDSQPEQLGYMAVLSVQPIYVCLATHRLLPQVQAEPWEDFWNLESISFVETASGGVGQIQAASVDSCDDGRQLYLEVRSKNGADRDRAVEAALEALEGFTIDQTERPCDGIRITIEKREGASDALARAAKTAAAMLDDAGYFRSGAFGV
ncbi:MAG: serine protease [Steroidobacteraceae bacterium]